MSDENACGTAGCFAGWRCFLDGYTDVVNAVYARREDGKEVAADRYAIKRLELNRQEASRLFNAENTLADLKEIVDDLCAQPDRSEESRLLLRETMDAVLAADAVGRWYQGSWFLKAFHNQGRLVRERRLP